MNNLSALCQQVRQIAYQIHLYLGHGHLEKVYENALAHRLSKEGFDVQTQYPIQVYDEDGTLIGEYLADLWVEETLLIELKAAKSISVEHEAQILGYLKATKMENGLLVNFGSYRFTARKYTWKQRE